MMYQVPINVFRVIHHGCKQYGWTVIVPGEKYVFSELDANGHIASSPAVTMTGRFNRDGILTGWRASCGEHTFDYDELQDTMRVVEVFIMHASDITDHLKAMRHVRFVMAIEDMENGDL